MADGETKINTAHLSAAGQSCGNAADSIRKAADQLAGADVGSGIFGDFAEAHAFHAKLSAAKEHHREQLDSHHGSLRSLSEQAGMAARVFGDTDDSAADDLGAAGDGFR